MIVIYGTRNAGKVDHRDGQYAITRFAHVYGLPLFPTGAVWMMDEANGHAMKLSWKSVLAGYARTWGPVAGVIGVFTGGVALLAGLAAAALAAATLVWKDVRAPSAQRMSDLNLLSYGTRCDPKQLPRAVVDELRPQAETRWAQLSGGVSPSDVARFGTTDGDHAAAAYAVLRLSALGLPPTEAAEAEADARRIADGMHDSYEIDSGAPYRTAALVESIPTDE